MCLAAGTQPSDSRFCASTDLLNRLSNVEGRLLLTLSLGLTITASFRLKRTTANLGDYCSCSICHGISVKRMQTVLATSWTKGSVSIHAKDILHISKLPRQLLRCTAVMLKPNFWYHRMQLDTEVGCEISSVVVGFYSWGLPAEVVSERSTATDLLPGQYGSTMWYNI